MLIATHHILAAAHVASYPLLLPQSIFALPDSPISFKDATGGLSLPPSAPRRAADRRPRGSLPLPPAPPAAADARAKRARLEQFLEEDLRRLLGRAPAGADASASEAATAAAPAAADAAAAAAARVEPEAPSGSRAPVFESDEAIAAQKAAARERMAAMASGSGSGSGGAGGSGAAAAASSGGGAGTSRAAVDQSQQQQQQQDEQEAEMRRLAGLKKAAALEVDPAAPSRSVPALSEVPARPRPLLAPSPSAAAAAALAAARRRAPPPVVARAPAALWLALGLAACAALQCLEPLRASSPPLGAALAFAPKGRLLLRLQRHPWALAALPAAALAALLPALLRAAPLHFADAAVEAKYAAWFNRRHAARDLFVHALWLAAAVAAFVRARAGAGGVGGAFGAGFGGGGDAAAAALAPLALLGPAVPAALAAALRHRWYAARRERVLVAARLAQALAALALRAAAPARLAGAWPLLAGAQVAGALLMRVRLSAFLPAQLLHVLVAACADGACAAAAAAGGGGASAAATAAAAGAAGAAAGEDAGGVAALAHVARLVGFGWCAPALLVLALEARSRGAFVQRGWARSAARAHSPAALALAPAAALATGSFSSGGSGGSGAGASFKGL